MVTRCERQIEIAEGSTRLLTRDDEKSLSLGRILSLHKPHLRDPGDAKSDERASIDSFRDDVPKVRAASTREVRHKSCGHKSMRKHDSTELSVLLKSL